MREILKLQELPDDVGNAVMAAKSRPEIAFNLIEEGCWKDIDKQPYQQRTDIFFYLGRFWRHVKTRTKAIQYPNVVDDPELVRVFPITKQITVYE